MPEEGQDRLTTEMKGAAAKLGQEVAEPVTEMQKAMSEAGVKVGEPESESAQEIQGTEEPFDVWWGSISEAERLRQTVTVARDAFRAGRKPV